VIRTPLRRSPWLSAATGADVLLKLETLQPTFSYKIRGAFNVILRLAETASDTPPLVTASAGNHGRALALAAQTLGMRVTVYVPASAPRTKLDAIVACGAELVPCTDYDEAELAAKEHGASGRALYISPYSHPDVIAGAGTVGLEILEDRPDVDAIVAPVGGGGLVSGIAITARALSSAFVTGVEVEASSPFTQGLAAGRIVKIDVAPTLADSLAGNLDPDTVTFDIVRALVSNIARVAEPDLQMAVSGLATEERLIVEGGGASGVAAAIAGKLHVAGQRVAIVVSGANIDIDKFKALILLATAVTSDLNFNARSEV
jgi:threonine dehydratase